MVLASILFGLATVLAVLTWFAFEAAESLDETYRSRNPRSYDAQIAAAKVMLAGLFIAYAALMVWFRRKGAGAEDITFSAVLYIVISVMTLPFLYQLITLIGLITKSPRKMVIRFPDA